MKKTLLLLVSLVMLVPVFASGNKENEKVASESSAVAQKEVYEIKLGHVLSSDHPVHIAMIQMSEGVNKRTNGAVDIQVYPNGELASYKDGPEAVLSGAAYMFYSSPGQFADQVPDFVALQAPFLYDSFDHYSKLMDTDVIAKLGEQAENKGIHVLSLNFVSGFRNLLTGFEVNSVSDIENLKIRVPGSPVFVKPFELMNTNPSAIAWSETYTSLQQGVVDAIEGTSNNIYNAKMYEVKNIITETQHILDLSGLFIGDAYWKKLPAEYQDIITEEVKKAEVVQNTMAKDGVSEYKKILTAAGATFNSVDKSTFKEATASIINSFDIGPDLLKTLEEIR